MKKTLVVGLAIGLVSLAASSFAVTGTNNNTLGRGNTGGAGIVGSSHDLSDVGGTKASGNAEAVVLSNGGQADAQGRICVYCHHPHNTIKSATSITETVGTTAGTLTYSPLWNREVTDLSFSGYDNGLMMDANNLTSDKRHALNASTASGNLGTDIKGVSLLCMSCHDGVTAMSAYSQNTGSVDGKGVINGTGNKITGSRAALGTDLKNHHPMGFNYDQVATDDLEIHPATDTMIPGLAIGDLLYGADRTMECVSCHDVHNSGNEVGAERFLWKSNNGSAFCLACHNK
jgi:predicted CXXCH cytochrome family protein